MSKLQRPRLGRGLSSLLSVSELPVAAEIPTPADALPKSDPIVEASGNSESIAAQKPTATELEQPAASNGTPLTLPVDQIHPNPHQPRRTFDSAKIAELAASLKSNGLVQPIVVRRVDDGFQLIAGERRLRAAKLAGLETVPCFVRQTTSYEQAQLALVENIQREDLNPIERATSYRTLINQLGLTQAELGARLGEDRSSIANYLRLLELSEKVREMIGVGTLSMGHAKLLAGLTDQAEQVRLAELVVGQGLSVRNLERVMSDSTVSPSPKSAIAPSAHEIDLERTLARQLGLRVQLRKAKQKGRGRLIIHYATLDEFDDLLDRLGVSAE